MALIRWEPVRELSTLQSDMNRLFNSFFDTTASDQRGVRRWVPAMDVSETEREFVVRADLPGLTEQDVAVELDDNVLTISGERSSEHEEQRESHYRVERASGSFARSLTLPEGVDPDAVSASFERGVLEVRVPKPAAHRPRRVSIAVGGSGGAAPTIEGRTGDAAGEAAGGGDAA